MTSATLATIIALVKDRLGIMSTVRDNYISAIVESVVDELTNVQGLELEDSSSTHLLFCVDLATWRYMSRDSKDALPRHLQFRLHNLIISQTGDATSDL